MKPKPRKVKTGKGLLRGIYSCAMCGALIEPGKVTSPTLIVWNIKPGVIKLVCHNCGY